MISLYAYIPKPDEKRLLEREFHEAAARYTEEQWQYCFEGKLESLRSRLSQSPEVDLLSWDVTGMTIPELEAVRRDYPQAYLLVLADQRVSPMSYLRPSVLPSALLIRPFSEQQTGEVLKELVEGYLRSTGREGSGPSLLVETRDGRQRIPYTRILFAEAREKKLYIHTDSGEYGFYETIEHLAEKLPATFVRSHRSYIVNMDRADGYDAELSAVRVGDQLVPVSRNCRKAIREFVRVHERG